MRAIVLILLLAACTRPGSVPDTNSAVLGYQQAVRSDNPRDAYNLLAAKVRKQLRYSNFAALWRTHRQELASQAKQLEAAITHDPNLGTRALVSYSDGKQALVVREGRKWKLALPLSGDTGSAHPKDTVRLLSRALRRQDYKKIVPLLSVERRKMLHEQIVVRFTKSLAKHVGLPMENQTDDTALFEWEDRTGRYQIILVREDLEWRIHDLKIEPKMTELPPLDESSSTSPQAP